MLNSCRQRSANAAFTKGDMRWPCSARNCVKPRRFSGASALDNVSGSRPRCQVDVMRPVKRRWTSSRESTRTARSRSFKLCSPSVKSPARRSVSARAKVFEPCQPGFPIKNSSTVRLSGADYRRRCCRCCRLTDIGRRCCSLERRSKNYSGCPCLGIGGLRGSLTTIGPDYTGYVDDAP